MNEIKPTYASFEQAKLLKEKGFEVECINAFDTVYPKRGVLPSSNNKPLNWNKKTDFRGNPDTFISAPEQWQVVDWISLVYDVDIEARPVRFAGDLKASYYQPYINGCVVMLSKFKTRQEALSEAINHFLKEY